jgi:predicted metal-dependent hydrolase
MNIQLGKILISVARKNIKNVHLTVHPPEGRVTLSAPINTRSEVLRAYAISKLAWIKEQQKKLEGQSRQKQREFIDRESHYVWGRRYLMTVSYEEVKPTVILGNKQIKLVLRANSLNDKRAEVIHEWHKSLLHELVPKLINKWERKLGVRVSKYYLQRMKTRWGSCNFKQGNIRLNTELVKKPKDLLEYVVVHEMVHLIEPSHNDKFIAILNQHYPNWREARLELNELPL